ncbi:MAG: TetR/AcrR family transcriptional regulator [Chloroflexota bacterium]
MPRRRQIELNEATREEIKATARQLMAEKGTAGLSLRAIARNMDMTAPALYHYFGSLDDLITALILDGFNGYADYVQHQRNEAAAAGMSIPQQIFVAMMAYREWAVQHPVDFQLLYGNPIPGYQAPTEITTPAATRMGQVFMELLMPGLETGEISIPEPQRTVPAQVKAHYSNKYGMEGETRAILHMMNQMWSFMFGLVALEIYNHTTPVVGDAVAFYEQATRSHLQLMGIKLD